MASRRVNLLPDCRAVCGVAKPDCGGDEGIFELAQHLNYIVILTARRVNRPRNRNAFSDCAVFRVMRLRPIVLAILAGSAAMGQQTTIHTTVPLLTIPVTVTDQSGLPVDGLGGADFELLDNGKPVPVSVDVLESGLSPIALVTLVQTSNMSLAALARVKKVGSMIPLEVAGANGSVAVLTYDSAISVVQGFTKNPAAVSDAFAKLRPADAMNGRMLDAVDEALDMLAEQPGGPRANILVIGETRDHGSEQKLDEIVQKIQRTGVTIYGMSYSKLITPFTMKPDEYQPTGGGYLTGLVELGRLAKHNAMRTLTQITGGEEFRFEIKAGLEEDLMRLSREIHNRYLLSFTPATEDPVTFHRIEVVTRNHPDLKVRTRPGYWSLAAR